MYKTRLSAGSDDEPKEQNTQECVAQRRARIMKERGIDSLEDRNVCVAIRRERILKKRAEQTAALRYGEAEDSEVVQREQQREGAALKVMDLMSQFYQFMKKFFPPQCDTKKSLRCPDSVEQLPYPLDCGATKSDLEKLINDLNGMFENVQDIQNQLAQPPPKKPGLRMTSSKKESLQQYINLEIMYEVDCQLDQNERRARYAREMEQIREQKLREIDARLNLLKEIEDELNRTYCKQISEPDDVPPPPPPPVAIKPVISGWCIRETKSFSKIVVACDSTESSQMDECEQNKLDADAANAGAISATGDSIAKSFRGSQSQDLDSENLPMKRMNPNQIRNGSRDKSRSGSADDGQSQSTQNRVGSKSDRTSRLDSIRSETEGGGQGGLRGDGQNAAEGYTKTGGGTYMDGTSTGAAIGGATGAGNADVTFATPEGSCKAFRSLSQKVKKKSSMEKWVLTMGHQVAVDCPALDRNTSRCRGSMMVKTVLARTTAECDDSAHEMAQPETPAEAEAEPVADDAEET